MKLRPLSLSQVLAPVDAAEFAPWARARVRHRGPEYERLKATLTDARLGVLFESGEATSNLGKGMDDPHKAVWDFTNKEGMLVSRVTTHRQHVRGRESAAVVALDAL